MKNVQIKVDNMGNAMVTADKQEMLVMVTWNLNDYNNEYYGQYSISTTFGYSEQRVDNWDVEYKTKEHKDHKLIMAMFTLAKMVLEMSKPVAPEKIEVEEITGE